MSTKELCEFMRARGWVVRHQSLQGRWLFIQFESSSVGEPMDPETLRHTLQLLGVDVYTPRIPDPFIIHVNL